LIKIVFVKSSINDADMLTKNVRKEANEKHVMRYLEKKQDSNLNIGHRKGIGMDHEYSTVKYLFSLGNGSITNHESKRK
jgi:hypothetical protein